MIWNKTDPDAVQISVKTDENKPEQVISEVDEDELTLACNDTACSSSRAFVIKNSHAMDVGQEVEEKMQVSNETEKCALYETESMAKNKEANTDYNGEHIIPPSLGDTDPLVRPISGAIEKEKNGSTLKVD